jgi:hypothetical protein
MLTPKFPDDPLMGAQLTTQWELVKSGTKHQLIFGAMMLRLRERCDGACAVAHLGNEARKGTGLKTWLAQHAPTVSERSAYRMMQVAEGIRDDLRLGKTTDLEALLVAQREDLPAKLAEKRVKIDEVIDGKSQRQLLLEFGRGADGRTTNSAGFRPNALLLRAWLEEQYPDRPELLESDIFAGLPEEIQRRFKAEGRRYEERLTNDQREEMQQSADARAWNAQIESALTIGIDREYYLRATDDQLRALHDALNDLRALVHQTQSARAGKRRSRGNGVPA